MFSTLFISLLLEALPFVLIGSLLSAMIEVLVSPSFIVKTVPKNKIIAMFLSPFLGLLFPACECVIVVIIRRLLKKGLPLYVAIPYMLSGTIINVVVMASTYLAYRNSWSMVVLRSIGGYVVALLVAYIIFLFSKGENILKETDACCHNHDEHNHDHDHQHERSFFSRIKEILETTQKDFFYISKFLILGIFLSSLINSFVPREILTGIGTHGVISHITMIFLAYVLSICSEADAFVASSFSTFTKSSQLAFLIFGPMLDIKLTLMYSALFKPKYTLILMCAIFASVLIFSLLAGIFI